MRYAISAILLNLVLPGMLVAQPQSTAPSLHSSDPPPIRFEHLTEKDGLSQGCAYAIHQDERGFLWIGTQDGLNRYDGYGFKVYYPGVRDSTSLATGFIIDIAEGRDGVLWLAGEEVLTRFDPITETFRHFRHDPGDPSSLPYGPVEAVIEDRNGGVWAGTGSGLSYMAPDNLGSFTRFHHDPADASSLSSDVVFEVLEDRSGQIWVLTARGLNRVERGEKIRFARYLVPADGAAQDRWRAMLSVAEVRDDEGALWIGTAAGLLRFEPGTGRETRFVPSDLGDRVMPIFSLVADVENPSVLWVGSRVGFYRFDTRDETFTAIRHNPTDPRTIPGDVVDAIYADRSGTVWVSAACGGLSRFNTTAARFALLPVGNVSDGVRSMGAGAVLSDGTILVGIRDGDGSTSLNLVDPDRGVMRSRRIDPGYIRGIIESQTGTFWVANRGLMQVDRDLNVLRQYLHDPYDSTTISSDIVASAIEDREGRVWVGTVRGLDLLDPATGVFKRFTPGGIPDSVIREEVRAVLSLAQSSDGAIWLSTRFALHRFDPETESFTTYRHDPADPQTVNSWIRWIYEHPREPGVLWLGGTGLARMDVRTAEISHFTTSDGLPNNIIYGILGDDSGNVWLSTNRGLSRFDPATRQFMNFGLEHGLQGLEFNEKSAFAGPDGRLYFGGLRGLTVFHPSEITKNPIPPTVILTDLLLFNQPVPTGTGTPLERGLDRTQEIRLKHDQNHVAFDFVGLHFQNPAKNTYAYQLEGFDDRWIDAGIRREATYANLAPGRYIFHVKAANSDGVWSEARTIGLTILPPWWQTWWAYFLYAAIVGVALVFVHRVQKERVVRLERERARERELAQAREIERANRELEARNEQLRLSEAQLERQNQQLERQNTWIEEQNRKLRELDEVKSRFFANISHEFRTPLTLILGPLDSAVRRGRRLRQDDLPAMRRSARRLLRLINQLLDLSRIDAGAMELQTRPTHVARLLRRLVSSFSSLADRRGLALVYDGPMNGEMVGRVDPDKLEQVVTNLLSNALKFTPRGGKIRVAARMLAATEADDPQAPMAEIVVEDTGRGIPPESLDRIFDRFYQVDGSATRESEGTGIGLALTRELVELHGGTIEVQSKPGFGTAFTIRLPLPEVAPHELEASDEPDAPLPPAGGDGSSADKVEEVSAEPVPPSVASRGTVLVVDDNSDMRVYLQRLLRRAGYAVELAEDGLRGKERALAVVPDLVIADVMMPQMDGFELCRAMKEDDRLAHVPIVLLTARAAEGDRLEGLGAGADDYLAKPFSPEELKLRLENLIEIRRRLRRQYSETVRLGPEEIPVTSADATFIEQIRTCIERDMGDSQFSVEALAGEVGLSPRQLHRRLKDLTGLTPGGYIRMMRLQRAEQMLRQQAGHVAEVAYAVGFNDAKYFSRLFRQTFGCPPSEYVGTDLT